MNKPIIFEIELLLRIFNSSKAGTIFDNSKFI